MEIFIQDSIRQLTHSLYTLSPWGLLVLLSAAIPPVQTVCINCSVHWSCAFLGIGKTLHSRGRFSVKNTSLNATCPWGPLYQLWLQWVSQVLLQETDRSNKRLPFSAKLLSSLKSIASYTTFCWDAVNLSLSTRKAGIVHDIGPSLWTRNTKYARAMWKPCPSLRILYFFKFWSLSRWSIEDIFFKIYTLSINFSFYGQCIDSHLIFLESALLDR